MPVAFRQLPWSKLTRNGSQIPPLLVARRPMVSLGVTFEPGQPVPPPILLNKLRLRQLYDARLIVPEGGPIPAFQIPKQVQSQPEVQAIFAPRSSTSYTPPRKRK